MENKNYTTKEDVEIFLNESITDNIDIYILAAQKIIEEYTQRNFLADKDDTERLYDGNGSNELIIDPAIEITNVEIDGVAQTFLTFPYNELPIYKIILETNCFPRDYKNVAITGKFGYSECIPDDIKFVATSLVAKMIKGNIKSDISAEKIGEYSVNYGKNSGENPNLLVEKSILDLYKKL